MLHSHSLSAVLLASLALAACSSPSTEAPAGNAEQPATGINRLLYAGPTIPASNPLPVVTDFDCPEVIISESGASIRQGGEGAATRWQASLNEVARECVLPLNAAGVPDGKMVRLKVGLDGYVLLGPAGSVGRFDIPASVVVKNRGAVVTQRSVRLATTMTAGETQAVFRYVFDDLMIPLDAKANYTVELALREARPEKKAGKKAR